MPKIKQLTSSDRMNTQLLAMIDKYKRLNGVKTYGDLGPLMGGRCATTAVQRINRPGRLQLDELRELVRNLHIPPEEFLEAVYEKRR